MNGDLALRVRGQSESRPWEASPSGTVWRKRLHRVGAAEAGQVTSLVRFEPGATFGDHGHPQGEEILVLEGTFFDETGSWGRGWYLVSPAGTNHAPFSAGGCTLFVKLQQFAGPGRPPIKLDTSDMPWRSTGNGDVEEKILFRQEPFADSTRLERWRAGARVERPCPGGLEIFVLDGRGKRRSRERFSRGGVGKHGVPQGVESHVIDRLGEADQAALPVVLV